MTATNTHPTAAAAVGSTAAADQSRTVEQQEEGPWRMVMCVGPDAPLIERRFASVQAWETWLGDEHRSILRKWSSLDDPHIKQYGTGYYWSSLQFTPTRQTGDQQ